MIARPHGVEVVRRGVERLNKPHYLFRPVQLFHRLGWRTKTMSVLPWGASIAYDARDAIGGSIARTGVYELVVTELLLRLAARGETAVDVGANIGYMTSVLSAGVGPTGRVIAFEPHPVIAARLRANSASWKSVSVREKAVSDRTGTATLAEPPGFSSNQGTAMLASDGSLRVELTTLDDELGDDTVGVLKLDVEGHELEALRGAQALLRAARIRDIAFEEHHEFPSPVTRELEANGYTVLGVFQGVRGIRLTDPDDPRARSRWNAPTFLATLDEPRARTRTATRGWVALRRGRPAGARPSVS